jgi:hypothetical protein
MQLIVMTMHFNIYASGACFGKELTVVPLIFAVGKTSS